MTIQIFQTIQLISLTCVNCIRKYNLCAAVVYHIRTFHATFAFRAFLQSFQMVRLEFRLRVNVYVFLVNG